MRRSGNLSTARWLATNGYSLWWRLKFVRDELSLYLKVIPSLMNLHPMNNRTDQACLARSLPSRCSQGLAV
jgi:hypothetical protein